MVISAPWQKLGCPAKMFGLLEAGGDLHCEFLMLNLTAPLLSPHPHFTFNSSSPTPGRGT